jgi:hypothetical protein
MLIALRILYYSNLEHTGFSLEHSLNTILVRSLIWYISPSKVYNLNGGKGGGRKGGGKRGGERPLESVVAGLPS